jgi:hypothetical protein
LIAAIAVCASLVPAIAHAACTGPVYHQYDYFVGRWNVYNHSGKQFATDVVSRELDGCALLEQWHGKTTQGAGYSAYEPHTKRWVQTFFTNDGQVLVFHGSMTARGMLFTGEDYTSSGAPERDKVLFRPLKGGGFEEYWTVSPDGSRWNVVFDGFFRPR